MDTPDSSRSQKKYDVFFLVPSADDVSSYLQAAFDTMDKNNMDPKWMTEEECLASICDKRPELFICDPFEGKAFDHLAKLKCRVLGPLCILMCFQHNEALPRREHPVFSLSMRRAVVTFSNLAVDERTSLAKKVELMGGQYTSPLRSTVTHLVTGRVGSEKYHVATKHKMAIMLPQWIEELWEEGQYELTLCNSPAYDKFRCSVFSGLNICVSQVESGERQKLKEIIEQNGGSYSGVLRAKQTTHLILKEPSGEKFKFARKWRIECIRVEWLHESLKAGYAVEEKNFRVEKNGNAAPETSTPTKSQDCIDITLPDFSVISNVSCISKVDETAAVSFSLLNEQKTSKAMTAKSNGNALESLDNLDVSGKLSASNKMYLDGCYIHLHGFTKTQFEKLKKIINAGGGMWLAKFSHQVSHIVVANEVPDSIKQMEWGSSKPFIVNVSWLLDSFKASSQFNEAPYVCYDIPDTQLDSSTSKMSKNASFSTRSFANFTSEGACDDIVGQYVKENSSLSLKSKAPAAQDVITIDDENDNSYARSAVDSTLNNSLSNTVTAKSEATKTDNQTNLDVTLNNDPIDQPFELQAKSNDRSSDNDAVSSRSADCQEEQLNHAVEDQNDDGLVAEPVTNKSMSTGLFGGNAFMLVGFGPKDTEILTELIETNGGLLVSSDDENKANIAVVPIVEGSCENISVKEIVTNCWLLTCIEKGMLLPLDWNPLFKPITTDISSKPLKNCVITFSKYAGPERDTLTHLACSLGATCQEYFNRKFLKNKGLLPNTHLVLPLPEGDKFIAAKKWKIFAVTKYWILETAYKGRYVPEDLYLVEVQPDIPNDLPSKEFTISEQSGVLNNEEIKHDDDDNEKLRYNNQQTKTKSVTEINEDSPSNHKENINSEGNNQFKQPLLLNNQLQHLKSGNQTHLEENTPSRILNPNFKPTFQFDNLHELSMLETPKGNGSEIPRRRMSTPLIDLCERNLLAACERFGKRTVSDNEVAKDKSTTNEVLNSGPLSGVVVCVSKSLAEKQLEFNEIVTSLGGTYHCQLDSACTHFIYQGKSGDMHWELKSAKEICKYIVSPAWLYDCKQTQSRVNEDNYPYTYNAMLLLSELTPNKSESLPRKEDVNVDQQASPSKRNNEVPTELASPCRNHEDISKQLDELMNVASSSKKLKRRKSSIFLQMQNLTNANAKPVTEYKQCEQKTDSANAYVESLPPESSQHFAITWDDPTGRMEREKLAEHLAQVQVQTLDTMAFSDACPLPSDNKDNNESKEPEKEEIKRAFMLSGFSNSEKGKYVNIINNLGGEVLDSKFGDSAVTHLVLFAPLKSEKFLCCVAAGKWILHKSYLDESQASGHFIAEEDYEWGGPCSEPFFNNLPAKQKPIGEIPYRWRTRLAEKSSPGAFADWTVYVFAADKEKTDQYTRILTIGGACVIRPNLPLKNDEPTLDDVTLAFVETSQSGLTDQDLELLIKKNIPCVKPEYLAFYLTENPSPPPENYEILKVVELRKKLGKSFSLKRKPNDNSSVLAKRNRKTLD